jgi:hypothetical protein
LPTAKLLSRPPGAQLAARTHGAAKAPYDMHMAPFTVTRNALIPAAPSDIFPFVNNFHEWTKWSPWEAVDPKLNRTYSGNESGVGAKYAWSGNNKAGSGTMEIVGSEEPRKINIRLEFTKPMKAVNPTSFTLVPEGDGTRVTWTMTGENKGLGKIFALFMNMDKLVGRDFEKGLGALSVAATQKAS